MDFTNHNRDQYRAAFETEHFTASVLVAKAGSQGVAKKARVYVWGAPVVDDHGVDYGDDKSFAQYQRKVSKAEREVLAEALAESSELAGLLAGIKLSFSRTAGCSCGCSPGFIVEHKVSTTIGHDTHPRNVTDIFVTRKEAVSA